MFARLADYTRASLAQQSQQAVQAAQQVQQQPNFAPSAKLGESMAAQ